MTGYYELAKCIIGKRCEKVSNETYTKAIQLMAEILKRVINPNEADFKKAEEKYRGVFEQFPDFAFLEHSNKNYVRINICQKEENEFGEDAINLAMDALRQVKWSASIGCYRIASDGSFVGALTEAGNDLFFEIDKDAPEWLNVFLTKVKTLEEILKSVEATHDRP